ncbi:hypothetical protein BKE38_15700 [Pseudoroseomonas deserti]|uniref:Glycosyl hydrolase family 32 N-terminal domain-containing protein n=1 Tax=Teichococcus deserti TaxID=1817963 RepID=A0A1V2H2C2_9PROT|nr:hypothetical protein [Pseudoroseomonas deserti]ONG51677.1 hypothetical protein BKE38_15700 [Pseudoroseomonas deserti]
MTPLPPLPAGRLLLRPLPGCWWMAGGLGAFCPMLGPDGALRLYLGGRDAEGRSHIGRLDFDGPPEADRAPALRRLLGPLLSLGAPGCFDADGTGYPWLVEADGAMRMYYVGWQRLGGAVPFRNQIGLAISRDGGDSFFRFSRAPLLPANDAEPIGHGSCAVQRLSDGRWRLLYTSFLEWAATPGGGHRHRYQLHTAWSEDGLDWQRPGDVAVPLADAGEYALGAPAPWRAGDGTERIVFTARGDRYRLFLGTADGPGRFRRHPAPLVIPAGDWDDAMQCYPRILRAGDHDVLFYAGNGYGRAGIGFLPLPAGWPA